MILMIDNHDSFTYNIVQYFLALQQSLQVWKNDSFTLAEVAALAPKAIIIGPGPCTPDDAGLTLDVIREFQGRIPILGICLGHQAIAQAFGATIVQAERIMHGRVSKIYHRHQGVFENLPNPCQMTRYHSLLIEPTSLPACLEMTAWTQAIPTQTMHAAKKASTVCLDDLGVVTKSTEPSAVAAQQTSQMIAETPMLAFGSAAESQPTRPQQLPQLEIMGIRHRTLPIEGVQFHPESILSEAGYQLLNNFLHRHGLAMVDNQQLPCTS